MRISYFFLIRGDPDPGTRPGRFFTANLKGKPAFEADGVRIRLVSG